MAIISLTEFKTYTGLAVTTWDSQLTALITAVQDMLEKACDRTFDETIYTGATAEYIDGTGTSEITIRNIPVTTLSSMLLVDNSGNTLFTYTSDMYALDGPSGRLSLDPTAYMVGIDNDSTVDIGYVPRFPVGKRNVKVSYTGGYSAAAMPTSLKLAMVRLVNIAFNNVKFGTDLSLASERIGDYSYSRGDSGSGPLSVSPAGGLEAAIQVESAPWSRLL